MGAARRSRRRPNCARRASTDATLAALATHLPLLAEPAMPESTDLAEELEVEVRSLGELHQSLLDDDHRHRRGVHYTPSAVARALVARASSSPGGNAADPSAVPLVCDPSCGGGVFLVALAEHVAAGGVDPARVVGSIHGVDLDPLAVEVARVSVVAWAAGAGLRGAELVEAAGGLVERIVVGDALTDRWPGEGRLELVVGNPPFAGQLARTTARDDASAEVARALLGGAAPGYADTAGLFLVRAAVAAAPGARISLIQPLSFLGSHHAGVVRRRLDELAVLSEVWVAEERVFGAAVDVCAPVLQVLDPFPIDGGPCAIGRRGRPDVDPVVVSRGTAAVVVGDVARGRLAAGRVVGPRGGPGDRRADGRPRRPGAARRSGAVRRRGSATSSTPSCPTWSTSPIPTTDRTSLSFPPGHAALVTAGLVEPARILWGRHPTRFAGRRLLAPAVDVERIARRFGRSRRRPTSRRVGRRPVASQGRRRHPDPHGGGGRRPQRFVVAVGAGDLGGARSRPRLRDRPGSRRRRADGAAGRGVGGGALGGHGHGPPCPEALGSAAARDPAPRRRRRLGRGGPAARAGRARPTTALGPGCSPPPAGLLTAAHGLPDGVDDAVLRWWAARAGCSEHF